MMNTGCHNATLSGNSALHADAGTDGVNDPNFEMGRSTERGGRLFFVRVGPEGLGEVASDGKVCSDRSGLAAVAVGDVGGAAKTP
jgi:hypothetical protein